MNAYSIIVDSTLLGAHLPRCLATLSEAARRHPSRVDILVIGPTDEARLTALSRRFGGRFTACDQDTIGARGNAAARTNSATILVFLSPHGRLRSDWLDRVNQLLDHQAWDAVIFQPHSPALLTNLRRLWHVSRPPGTLCVARQWFERIGGFDPALDSTAHEDLVERLRACHARIVEVPL
ncbi:hypothetical protein [Halomonas sp. YLGW01]|uniref:glycosyltransferase family 2 protein n=1 Tax=Halomonas sp. YLGW01 TaxID=2773308 RepID=UPI001781E361|nr:hypothetical protein [Halomonas sp. YLGW01]